MGTKRCPICKIEKSFDYFDTYFSKKRNRFRHQNYCKACSGPEKARRSALYYKEHKTERLVYGKNYRNENKEIIIKKKRLFKVKYRQQLQTCYVKELLTNSGTTKEFIESHPEIIQTKRLQIHIKRKIKTIKNAKK